MTKFEKLNEVFGLLGLCRVRDSFNNFYGMDCLEVVEEEDLDFMLWYIPEHAGSLCLNMTDFNRNEKLEVFMRNLHKGLKKAPEDEETSSWTEEPFSENFIN